MAEIRNCPRCGRIFNYIGRPICGQCLQDEEEEFKKVKEYIYEYPGSTISEVSQGTGVTVEKIMRFLRDERLEISSENSNLVLECERCHRPIKSGRFCEACKKELQTSISREFGLDKRPSSTASDRKTGSDRMYTATRRKDE